MRAIELIELQKELIYHQREKIERLEAELKAAYQITVKLAQTVNHDDFGSAPCLFAAEQAFRRVLNKQNLTTNYQFSHEAFRDKS